MHEKHKRRGWRKISDFEIIFTLAKTSKQRGLIVKTRKLLGQNTDLLQANRRNNGQHSRNLTAQMAEW